MEDQLVEEIVAHLRRGLTLREAAAQVDVRPGRAQHALEVRGLKVSELRPLETRRSQNVPAAAYDLAVQLIVEGATLEQAAAQIGVAFSSLSNALRRRGLSIAALRPQTQAPAPPAQGRVLDPGRVDRALSTLRSGGSVESAAESSGLSAEQVRRVVRRRGLQHLAKERVK